MIDTCVSYALPLRELEHMVAEGERRSESGRLDAEQVDEARDAMLLLPLHHKILRCLTGRLDLWADASVCTQYKRHEEKGIGSGRRGRGVG